MTTLFMDPFSQYGTNTGYMLQGPYAALSGIGLSAAPWDSSGAISIQGGFGVVSTSTGARRVLPTTKTAIITSCRWGIHSLPPGDNQKLVMTWLNSGGGQIAQLFCGTTGRLYLTNSSGTEVCSTQGPVIIASNWHHLEFKLDTSAGTFVLRIDDATGTGTPAINASGLSGVGGPIASVSLLPDNNWTVDKPFMRDLIVRDTAGTVNNGFNGDEYVAALFAVADTANAGWTPRFYQKFGAGILGTWPASNSGVVAANSTQTDLGSGDFTIETFARFLGTPSGSNYSTIMSKWDSANNRRSWRFILGGPSFNANCLQFDISTDGSAGTIATRFQYPWTPDIDRWYHMALVRTSGELLLFVDGNQLGLPIADSSTYYAGAEPTGIGVEVQGTTSGVANTAHPGWFDETRLTVGYARYTAPFAPPSAAFPRGSGSDPHWSNVAILCGYDNGIQDESGFGRALTVINGAQDTLVSDGPAIGSWSTLGVNKAIPDYNSFLTAPYTAATGTVTMTVQPANNDTVTIGTKDGSTAAVYTFKTAISSAFDVLIDTTAQNTLLNLYNAINAGSGVGTKYGTGTTANFDVTASQLPAGQLLMNANTLGTAGNSVAMSNTGTAITLSGSTLTGGLNIPGPSDFKVQRPPLHTTIISAVQLNGYMYKSDAGPCSVEMGLVGPVGGVNYGSAHPLTTSPVFYSDIIETDPDTSGPISPTTIVNGAIRLNRTA